MKTINGGYNWHIDSLENVGRMVRFVDENTGWMTGYEGAIYKTTNGGISSTADNLIEDQFFIYPNPAAYVINLTIDDPSLTDLTLNIYSLTGRILKSELLEQNQKQIDIGDLRKGIYLIELKSKERTKTQKLIIQ